MAVVLLPAGPWLPDLPRLNSPGCSDVLNVMPTSGGSYGPLSGIGAPEGFNAGPLPALDGPVVGAIELESPTLPVKQMLAATNDGIWFASAGEGWINVAPSGFTAYGVDAVIGQSFFDPTVRFVQFNDQIICLGGITFDMLTANLTPIAQGNPPSTPASPDFSLLLNDATDVSSETGESIGTSRGYYPAVGAIVKNFLVIGALKAAGNRLAWSGSNDASMWPTPGSNQAVEVQSDYEDLPGELGFVVQISPNLLYADAAIFCSGGIWRMVYTGPPDVFDFYPALSAHGTVYTNSIVEYGGVAYYLANDGFFVFDGINATPIGAEKVDRWFATSADLTRTWSVRGAFDVGSKCIVWVFASVGTTTYLPDTLLIYNTITGSWSKAQFAGDFIFSVASKGEYNSVPTLPLQSASSLVLWAFSSAHQIVSFSGAPMAASLTTRELEPGQQTGGKVWMRSARPLFDGAAAGAASITMNTRTRLDTLPAPGPVTDVNDRGVAPLRGTARFVSSTVAIVGGATWSSLQGVELELQPAGLR